MPTNWSYALLSQAAKAAGGPEKLAQSLLSRGRVQGSIITSAAFVIGKLFMRTKPGTALKERFKEMAISTSKLKERFVAEMDTATSTAEEEENKENLNQNATDA